MPALSDNLETATDTQEAGNAGGGVRRVRSLGALCRLAGERRAVISRRYGPLTRPKPAAFMLAWQGRMINDALKAGVYVYEKGKK